LVVLGAATGCGNALEVLSTDAGEATDAPIITRIDATSPGDARADAMDETDGASSGADDASDGAASCYPMDVLIPPFVPPRAPRAACTDTQIQTLYSSCFAGTAAACDAFKGDPDNSPCVLCMESASTNPTWAAVIEFPNDTSLANLGGCIALVDEDATPGSCAVAVQANDLCRRNSCAATCPSGATPAGLAAFQQCEAIAQSGLCAGYLDAAACDQDPRYSKCLFVDFEAYVRGIGRVFCEQALDGG
jgi:hypothetical protein